MSTSTGTVYAGERKPVLGGGLTAVVTKDGAPLPIRASQRIRNHSPSGFEWGYGGSGPAQLALALLLDATGDHVTAERCCQWFKWGVVANWSERWTITAGEVLKWVESFDREARRAIAAAEAEAFTPTIVEGGAA